MTLKANPSEGEIQEFMNFCDQHGYKIKYKVVCDETNNSEQDKKDNKINVCIEFKGVK